MEFHRLHRHREVFDEPRYARLSHHGRCLIVGRVVFDRRPVAHVAAELIDCLEVIGSPELITVLLDRDLATRLSLDDIIPDWSIRSPDDPTSKLPPSSDDPWGSLIPTDVHDRCRNASAGVKELVRRLVKVGANDQAAALVRRLPAAGRFYVWTDLIEDPRRFRFGRAHDGTPAAAWDWDDLR